MKNRICLVFLLLGLFSKANIILPDIISDGMVLQRNSEVTIWGWAEPGEEIELTESWTGKVYKTKTDTNAYWEFKITTNYLKEPQNIKLKGYNELSVNNILLGEVWFCSGQSNMDMNANWGIENGEEEIAQANFPQIRFLKTPKKASDFPQDDAQVQWQECTPETMKNNSAVAYYFARKLTQSLDNVPVGLIISAWGGTAAQTWIPQKAFSNDLMKKEAESIQPNDYCPTQPSVLYNGMVNPFVNYTTNGILWYQGESNVGSSHYDQILANLVQNWREKMGENLPFYFVQIAPYDYGKDHQMGAVLRNSQRLAAKQIPNIGMVTIDDFSPSDDIHPKNKKIVGERLAFLALNNTYKISTKQPVSPVYSGYKIQNNQLILEFKEAKKLHFAQEKPSFEVEDASGNFVPVKASIQGNQVVLDIKKIKNPKSVRFMWSNTSKSELFDEENMPASTFIDTFTSN